jgi:hypothetical protein
LKAESGNDFSQMKNSFPGGEGVPVDNVGTLADKFPLAP